MILPFEKGLLDIPSHMARNFKKWSAVIDSIFKMGDGCKLSSFSIHAAIRYLDLVYTQLVANKELRDNETWNMPQSKAA